MAPVKVIVLFLVPLFRSGWIRSTAAAPLILWRGTDQYGELGEGLLSQRFAGIQCRSARRNTFG